MHPPRGQAPSRRFMHGKTLGLEPRADQTKSALSAEEKGLAVQVCFRCLGVGEGTAGCGVLAEAILAMCLGATQVPECDLLRRGYSSLLCSWSQGSRQHIHHFLRSMYIVGVWQKHEQAMQHLN